jgi:hypothetical protein
VLGEPALYAETIDEELLSNVYGPSGGGVMRRRDILIGTLAVLSLGLAAPGFALGSGFKNVCSALSVGELDAAHVQGPCKKLKATRHATTTPLGSLTSEGFGGRWGALPKTGVGHVLTISVDRFSASSAVLAVGRKKLRAKVLASGTPVGVGSVSTWHGDTGSCPNPPTSDCTTSVVTAIVHNSLLTVVMVDYPVGGSESQEHDEEEDLAQEESDKAPVVAVAKSIAKHL